MGGVCKRLALGVNQLARFMKTNIIFVVVSYSAVCKHNYYYVDVKYICQSTARRYKHSCSVLIFRV